MGKQKQALDYEILIDGPISMYFKRTHLSNDIEELENLGYPIIELNTNDWDKRNFHKRLKVGFSFPDYYGDNFNAFEDCLNDLFLRHKKGIVIVFRNFSEFVEIDRFSSEVILDVISNLSRRCLLDQKRVICLVHSNDSDLAFEKLGGIRPVWNRNEWFNEDRRH